MKFTEDTTLPKLFKQNSDFNCYSKFSVWCNNNGYLIKDDNPDYYYCEEKSSPVLSAEEQIINLQDYLNSTDWYITRKSERGNDIPSRVIEQRNRAREEISNLRNTLTLRGLQ
ncbi:hypothetical protein Dip510_000069 [Elusimicrobium posterum]|uniref:hypothetical protein n=1 Tax=Elusimicrobium posterum TaxID=3116653 RepID=UPI003C736A28